jgi:hypothetical protein
MSKKLNLATLIKKMDEISTQDEQRVKGGSCADWCRDMQPVGDPGNGEIYVMGGRQM